MLNPCNDIRSLAWRISQYMQADGLTVDQLRRYAFVLEVVTRTVPDWRIACGEMQFDGLAALAPALASDLLDMCEANY